MKLEKIHFPETQILSRTILLVDDSPVNLGVVVEGLERHGFEVLVAVDGEEALERVKIVNPDLILLDVMMPGIDGFEVCRRLKAQEHTRDIPVLFMTSLSSVEDKVKGFDAGGVDYVTKPLQIDEVKARVDTHLALSDLKRKFAEKIAVQKDYLDRVSEEHLIAADYMKTLIALDKLKDPAVKFHLQPAENFSGDLIAVARTPGGRLHLMLADSTGHGLLAALAAIPMISPFYSMTSKGFGISAIAQEMNNEIYKTLPSGHFVAAILVSIDADGQMVEVWSGGCPPPSILNGEGKVAYQFKPRHLAMGVVSSEHFDASLEYFYYDDDGYRLLMYSDGVTELENETGEQFGLPRFLSAFEGGEPETRWHSVMSELNAYCGAGAFNHDDIAVLMARCELRNKLVGRELTQKHQMRDFSPGEIEWQFSLTLEMEQLQHLDVVPLLLSMVQQIEKEKGLGGEVFLIVSEMFNNALDHGVLKLDSALKDHEDGMERYFEERAARLASVESGQIHLHLKKIRNEDGNAFLRIRMKDSGDGFDHQYWYGRGSNNLQRHGRGILLLYNVCRSLQYLGNGSEVVAELDLAPSES